MEQPVDDHFKKVAAHEFDPLLENVHKGDFLLLDVRSPEEFRNENIMGPGTFPLTR